MIKQIFLIINQCRFLQIIHQTNSNIIHKKAHRNLLKIKEMMASITEKYIKIPFITLISSSSSDYNKK